MNFENTTQLRTWISDNQGDFTIKSDTGQHLQFDVFLEDVCSTIYRPAVWSVLGCCKEFIGPAVEYQGDQARLCYEGKPKLTLLTHIRLPYGSLGAVVIFWNLLWFLIQIHSSESRGLCSNSLDLFSSFRDRDRFFFERGFLGWREEWLMMGDEERG